MALQSAGSSFYKSFLRAALLPLALVLPASYVLAEEDESATPAQPVAVEPEKIDKPEAKLVKDGPHAEEPAVVPVPAVIAKPIAEMPAIRFTPLPSNWSTLSQTKASQIFRDIERRVNATNPAYPVVILDDDSINLRPTGNFLTFRNRVYEVLNDRGIKVRWQVTSDVLEALGGLKGPTRREPIAVRVKPDDYADSNNPMDKDVDQKAVCLVIPPVADVSSSTLVERWIGKTGTNYMAAKQDPGAYIMMQRAAWHEIWHCIDTEFYRDKYVVAGDSAINNSYRMHLSEVFADVGATLTLAMLGNLRTAQDMADIRAVSSYWNGRRSMRGARPSDETYYEGVTYYLTRAQDLVDKHIREVGAEAVSRYTIDDIRRIARDITLQGALSKEEFRQMADAYASGAGPSERVKLARQRMLTDTGRAIPTGRQPEDEDHYDMSDRLRDMPPEEKKKMEDVVQARIAQAVEAGQRPEQGIIGLIEEWRDEIHGSAERKPEFERNLYILSGLLAYGHLDKMLGREKVKEKAKETPPPPALEKAPEPQKPDPLQINPEIFKMPDFTPKFKWEPAPPVQAQIQYKFKLG